MADFLSGFRIAGSGMSAQRQRMNSISSNIANINTTRTPEGGPYRRKDVVFEAMPDGKTFGDIVGVNDPRGDYSRVQVTDVVSDKKAPLMKYDPSHPDANEGICSLSQYKFDGRDDQYDSDFKVLRLRTGCATTKDMALSALEIGR